MVDVMSHLHQYIPQIEYEESASVPGCNELVSVSKASTKYMMLSGDLLTKLSATASITLKANAEKPSLRLDGFIPTIDDWHCKLNLIEVNKTLNKTMIPFLLGYLEVCIFQKVCHGAWNSIPVTQSYWKIKHPL
jgi:hypothetical protein